MLAISNHEHNSSQELTMTVLGCGKKTNVYPNRLPKMLIPMSQPR